MKHTFDEEAARKLADMEEGLSVTAGSLDTEAFFRRVERQRASSSEVASPFPTVFGLFLNMARRERSLTLEALAGQVDSDVFELFLIEEGRRTPEPRIVSRLARALEVPPGRLMQLAGHVQSMDTEVAKAAYAFAARSNTKPLDPQEREALQEFVKALASS